MSFQQSVSSNAEEVGAELLRRAEAIPGLKEQGMAAAVQSLFVRSKATLTRLIYQKDIPRVTRTRGVNRGRSVLAWRRKMRNGGLLGAETFAIAADGSSAEIFTEPSSPAARYAEARHDLDRPSPIDGKTRLAPWRKTARDEGEADAIEAFRDVLRQGLGAS